MASIDTVGVSLQRLEDNPEGVRGAAVWDARSYSALASRDPSITMADKLETVLQAIQSGTRRMIWSEVPLPRSEPVESHRSL